MSARPNVVCLSLVPSVLVCTSSNFILISSSKSSPNPNNLSIKLKWKCIFLLLLIPHEHTLLLYVSRSRASGKWGVRLIDSSPLRTAKMHTSTNNSMLLLDICVYQHHSCWAVLEPPTATQTHRHRHPSWNRSPTRTVYPSLGGIFSLKLCKPRNCWTHRCAREEQKSPCWRPNLNQQNVCVCVQ